MASLPAASVTTTGRRLTPSVERIITWGWLMTGSCTKVPDAPGVGDGDGAAADVVGRQLAGAGLAGQVGDGPGDGRQAQVLGAVDHRDDQALVVEVDGDAEVDVVVHDELASPTLAFMWGNSSMASTSARAMNGR